MKTVQKSCIKNTNNLTIIPLRLGLNQLVFTLIHIIGIYSIYKWNKYYISYETIDFLNLKYFKLC